MNPQRAIIIVLVLFLIVAAGFIFLYSNQQRALIQNNLKLGEASRETAARGVVSAKAVAEIERQLENMVEKAEENPTVKNQTTARQAMNQTLDAIATEPAGVKDARTIEQKMAEMNALLDQLSGRKN